MCFPSCSEVPALPPPHIAQDEDQDDLDLDDDSGAAQQKFSRTSGPKVKDPYASDDSWFMPITIAVAVFLPVLFFLCRVK